MFCLMNARMTALFAPRFEGFFARLQDDGRWFVEGEHHHAVTVTAAGHATIGTGRFPSGHGITGNELIDDESGRIVVATEDAGAAAVGGEGGGHSARRLECDGLATWWRARWPDARLISASIKARAAIFALGGGGEAWWIDERRGRFVSSGAFVRERPEWLARLEDALAAAPGEWVPTLPDAGAYAELGCTADDVADEAPSGTNRARAFPHSLASAPPAARALAVAHSPFGDELLLDFGRAAVEALELGADDAPDLLVLALSATDLIGHLHGPDSWEVCEQILHLDRALAAFFEDLEGFVAPEETLIALTSDHGVCPLPAVARERGAGGGRVDWSTLGPIVDAQAKAIAPELAGAARPGPGHSLRIDRAAAQRSGLTLEEIADRLAARLRAAPGIADARSRFELARPLAEGDRVGELLRGSVFGERAGDVLFVLPAGTIYYPSPLTIAAARTALATSHGTPHDYDTAVPIVFLGAGVEPGRIAGRAFTADIAPTIALAVDASLPGDLDGRPLPLGNGD
jgi:hypothetical protein